MLRNPPLQSYNNKNNKKVALPFAEDNHTSKEETSVHTSKVSACCASRDLEALLWKDFRSSRFLCGCHSQWKCSIRKLIPSFVAQFSCITRSDIQNMNRVFGKKKKAVPAPSLDEASAGIGGRVDSMDSKIAGLENELRVFKDKIKKAKSPAAKKTLQKRAMEVLKRKKMYEQQRDMAAGQQFNIDQAGFGIESAKANVSTIAAMKAANTELKKTLKHDLDIDAVEDLADDMAEMFEDFNEINEALGRNFATPDDLDEADLDAELEMLEDELEEEAVEADATPSYLQSNQMPAFPTDVPGHKMSANQVDEYGLPAVPT
jgi:charged multivesicular body protein 5